MLCCMVLCPRCRAAAPTVCPHRSAAVHVRVCVCAACCRMGSRMGASAQHYSPAGSSLPRGRPVLLPIGRRPCCRCLYFSSWFRINSAAHFVACALLPLACVCCCCVCCCCSAKRLLAAPVAMQICCLKAVPQSPACMLKLSASLCMMHMHSC